MSLLLWVHEGLGDRDTARRLAKGHIVTVLRLQDPGSITVTCEISYFTSLSVRLSSGRDGGQKSLFCAMGCEERTPGPARSRYRLSED